jgi:predicted NBD/HSP70 family sugar kinase
VNDDDGLALALDVGGRTIKAELVDRAGTVVVSGQRPTPQGHRARDAVAEVGRKLLARRPDEPVVGAGVVVPGLVDREAGSHVTGAHDVAARLSRDAVARQVWQDAVEALADGLAIVSLPVGPALVLIGCGLSRAGEGLLDPLRVAFRQRTPVVHPADVTASALGDRGGVIGAALLARDGWAPES